MATFTTDNGQGVIDALRSAIVSASKDTYLPILCAVRVTVEGGELTAVGTDRYRLTTATVPDVTGDDLSIVLDRDSLASALKILPKRSTRVSAPVPLTFTVSDDGRLVHVGWGFEGATVPIMTMDGEYPRAVDSICKGDPVATVEIGFNPDHLADVKRHTLERNQSPRFIFHGENKPVKGEWTAYGVDYVYVIMPTRLTSTATGGAA